MSSGYRVELGTNGQPVSRSPLPELLSTGEPVPPWTPDALGRTRIVWVGKITSMKGWDQLESAADRLRDAATITVLLGHSPALVPVSATGQGLTVLQDLDDRDVPGFYRAADWLLSTSRFEGFGLAAAEALACGTPVLLPEQLGTARELLAADGGCAYRDLDHLVEIVSRPQRPVGRLPEHFDWRTNAMQTLRLYQDLIGR